MENKSFKKANKFLLFEKKSYICITMQVEIKEKENFRISGLEAKMFEALVLHRASLEMKRANKSGTLNEIIRRYYETVFKDQHPEAVIKTIKK